MGDEPLKTFFGAICLFPEPDHALVCEDKDGEASLDIGEKITTSAEHQQQPPSSSSNFQLTSVLNASSELVPFFDFFGAFIKFAKMDFEGNINKLRKKGDAVPQAKTFRQLLQYELDHKLSEKTNSACIVTVWFKRGLQFVVALLEGFVQATDASSHHLVKESYEATLKKYHHFLVQKSVNMAMKLSPQMSVVVKKLCYGHEELKERLKSDQQKYLLRLKPLVTHLHNLVIDLGLDKGERIS